MPTRASVGSDVDVACHRVPVYSIRGWRWCWTFAAGFVVSEAPVHHVCCGQVPQGGVGAAGGDYREQRCAAVSSTMRLRRTVLVACSISIRPGRRCGRCLQLWRRLGAVCSGGEAVRAQYVRALSCPVRWGGGRLCQPEAQPLFRMFGGMALLLATKLVRF